MRWLLSTIALVLVAFALGYIARVHATEQHEWRVYTWGERNAALERVNSSTGAIQWAELGCPWDSNYRRAYLCLTEHYEHGGR